MTKWHSGIKGADPRTKYEKYQDRDGTDRVGKQVILPRETGTGLYFRDRLRHQRRQLFCQSGGADLRCGPNR